MAPDAPHSDADGVPRQRTASHEWHPFTAHPESDNPRTHAYAAAATQSVVGEAFSALSSDAATEIVANLILAQVTVEATKGTYDAVEAKAKEWAAGWPRWAWPAVLAAAVLAVVLVLGTLLALWRFVLFGLGPICAR
ncbi:hypothetical protein DFJ74DRAFT_738151 [Hyaloraphidium curvatum]|nr:hypothetical protein DFJ74DRAFT_738151 [Hyaloraphidium curvatum]